MQQLRRPSPAWPGAGGWNLCESFFVFLFFCGENLWGDAYMHYEEGEESYPPHLRRYASPSGSGYWHPPLCCCGRPTCPAPERDW